ncbi:MAG: hypothetical protein ACI4N3_03280 [Alphaproteobacteria bacterium]
MVAKKKVTKTSTQKKSASKKVEMKKTTAKKSVVNPEVVETAKNYFKTAEKKVKKINIEKFLTDAFYMLLHPVKYFTSIKADGNYENAIVKVLMYGLLTAGIKIIFNIAHITLVGAISAIILMPIYALLITFGLAGIMLFFSYLAKGEMNFETSMKAVASCIFMYPLAFVAYQIAFNYYILFFFSLVIDLYIVFLIYTATTSCLKGEENLSKVIFGIFAAFVIILHFTSSGALYISNKNPRIAFKHHLGRLQDKTAKEIMPIVSTK